MISTRSDNLLAICAEGDVENLIGMSYERQEFVARARVPDFDRSVVAGGCHLAAIWTESGSIYWLGMAAKIEQLFAGCSIPNFGGTIRAGSYDFFGVWTKSHRENRG